MISLYAVCPQCSGQGWEHPSDTSWKLCAACDGIGRVWAAGAPSYGLSIKLGDRIPGEIVTLGNGDQGRILWHSPRGKDKKHPPTTTFLGIIDFGFESPNPIGYPSVAGVASVSTPRSRGDDDHLGDRGGDVGDPMQKNRQPTNMI